MGTDAITTTDTSQGQQQGLQPQQPPKHLSPIEIPELLALIARYLYDDLITLGRAAQVSSSFHAAFTPLFWRQIIIDGDDEDIWGSHKGFRMGMIRYGRFVEELQLTGAPVQDGDMELIAENFTRLKILNLSGTNVAEETLKVLIHSEPYRVQDDGGGAGDGGGKKRKAAAMGGSSPAKRKGGPRSTNAAAVDDDDDEEEEEEEEGLEEIERDGAVDAKTKMFKYREYTETETEHEFDSQYESMGIINHSSTATESEQDRPTGSIPRGSAPSAPAARGGIRQLAGKIPLHRRSGTTRPAKFKGTKTQFPFFLEELVLNRCSNLTGASVLKVVSRLGPQLKRLHLNHVAELSDRDVLDFMKHVPQLVELNVKGTEVTDTLLKGLADLTAGTGSEAEEAGTGAGGRAGLEVVNLNMLNVTPAGLIPLIKANKSTFKSISFEHNHDATNEVLYAFIEVPSNDKKAIAFTQKLQSTPKKGATSSSSIPSRAFGLNTVLTTLRVSYCTTLSDEGFAILFTAATELRMVEIDGTNVGDESLLALAATYRNRMKQLGYGVPAAWREFEIAEDEVLIAEHAKKSSEAGAAALLRKSLGFDPSIKVYSGHTVAGGLCLLSMKHCPRITNKGLRAIVRSCVNLEGLNVSNCGRISIEFFNGPWACTQLVNLMIAGTPLELMRVMPGYVTMMKEETLERQRFPLQEEEFPVKWEFDYQGYYDYIVLPMREIGPLDDEDNEDEDEEDEELVDDEAIMAAVKAAVAAVVAKEAAKNKAKKAASAKAETIRYKFPSDNKIKTLRLPPLQDRNTNAQRALLKQFYSKLGLLKKLFYFDMSQCNFRVRPKDGLELVLPGLQQSLDTWNLYRPLGYTVFDSDLEFFGRYFGYGRKDCPIQMKKLDVVEQERRVADEKAKKAEKAKTAKAKKAADAKTKKGKKKAVEEEDEDEDEEEDEEEEEDLPRVAKLSQLIVSKYATEVDLDNEVYEWFMDQDVELLEIDAFDYDMM